MKYRIITDTKKGFTLQRRIWGLFWWACDQTNGNGATYSISFHTVEEARDFMKDHIERRMAEKRAGKPVEVIKVTSQDRVAWRLSRK